jgi:hypothetical protein
VESDVWDDWDEDIDWEAVVEEVEENVNVGDVDEEVDIPCDDVDEFVMAELLSVVWELVGRDAELQEGSDQQVAAERRTSWWRRTTRRWRRT